MSTGSLRASGIAQDTPEATYCPDCDKWVETALFVEHREVEHPPSPRAVQGAGAIASQEAVGSPGGGSTEEA